MGKSNDFVGESDEYSPGVPWMLGKEELNGRVNQHAAGLSCSAHASGFTFPRPSRNPPKQGSYWENVEGSSPQGSKLLIPKAYLEWPIPRGKVYVLPIVGGEPCFSRVETAQ